MNELWVLRAVPAVVNSEPFPTIGMAPKPLGVLEPFLISTTQSDTFIQWFVVLLIVAYILFFGMVFEQSYSKRLVELYQYPWWRLLVVGLVCLGVWWSPLVGSILGLAVFFYLNDLDILTTPFLNKDN